MRYASIYPFDISNGPGIRVSVFIQGCNKHCPGCFNPETWDFNGGKPFDDTVIDRILDLCAPDYISGLSILGGEPFQLNDLEKLNNLCCKFKEKYPNKTIWIWTGYELEELLNLNDNLVYSTLLQVDAIIDGPFIESKKDLSLKWRGSSNQKIWMYYNKWINEKEYF